MQLAVKMQRSVSSLPLNPSVKVKLVGAGFQFTADLLHLTPLQLSQGNAHCHPPNSSQNNSVFNRTLFRRMLPLVLAFWLSRNIKEFKHFTSVMTYVLVYQHCSFSPFIISRLNLLLRTTYYSIYQYVPTHCVLHNT